MTLCQPVPKFHVFTFETTLGDAIPIQWTRTACKRMWRSKNRETAPGLQTEQLCMSASFLSQGRPRGNCKGGQSETTELDCSMGRNKALYRLKLSRPFTWERGDQNEGKASRFYAIRVGL